MMPGVDEFPNLDVYWSSSEEMSEVEDGSVQSVITSPPYWDLKDYGHEDQIGTSDESYDHYHDRLDTVWGECYDALKDTGTMWVVVDTVTKRGDLRLLPYHIAERAEELGFVLQDVVVWHKPTAIAGMTDRNVVNKKEYVVYLSKTNDHTFNEADAGHGLEDPAVSEDDRLGNIWRHPVKRGSVGNDVLHKAPSPTSLIDRIVRLSSDEGDTVLDPFLGSGTTAKSALRSQRKCVGYELNEDFDDVIADRLSELKQQSLTDF